MGEDYKTWIVVKLRFGSVDASYGPFESEQEAQEWADTERALCDHGIYWVVLPLYEKDHE